MSDAPSFFRFRHLISIPITLALLATAASARDSMPLPGVHTILPGNDVQYRLQSQLIEAVPGDVIQLEQGRYILTKQLDIATDNLTIRGAGSTKTILSFENQDTGSLGIDAIGNNLVIEGVALEDTSGNAIKVTGARNVTFRDVRTEWTGEASATSGAYGIYPVQCQNVLIDRCTAIGASDAGIYVGQCHNVIVRSSHAERNVVGIEIENTHGADVHDNVATNNAGGILVFDLPGLQVKSGRDVRVFRNKVLANNHRNFSAPGNTVASVPSGTGVMVMATDHVEVFENEIADNQTSSISIVSYLITGKKMKDARYDPICEAVSVHHNQITGGGKQPKGDIATLLRPVLGAEFPDILFDGVVNQEKLVDGKLPPELAHSIRENGTASFANFNVSLLTPKNIVSGKYRLERDLAAFATAREPLKPVKLRPHDPPSATSSAAVAVYRSAPKTLSEYGLFQGNGASQEPADGVIPYELNTPLFSDYAAKGRFIRIPPGTKIDFQTVGVLEFPIGTVIAKTFSYPYDMTDLSQGRRLLETRIETRKDDGWYGFSYRWNDEQTAATLSLGGGEFDVSWVHSDGKRRTIPYQIPNANQCLNCHSQDKAFVPIGPTAANLNRAHPQQHGGANQLDHMARLGMLHGLPGSDSIAKLPRYDDHTTGTVAERTRAWLDVNCAHCHSPGGPARTSGLDLRMSQTDPAKFGVWKTPTAAGHGTGGHDYDIVPGKPDASILVFRLESEDPSIMMPNVARRLVPKEAAALVRRWIAEMQSP